MVLTDGGDGVVLAGGGVLAGVLAGGGVVLAGGRVLAGGGVVLAGGRVLAGGGDGEAVAIGGAPVHSIKSSQAKQ